MTTIASDERKFNTLKGEAVGMARFENFLIENFPPEFHDRAQKAVSLWNKLHGNYILEHPTEDYQLMFKTYRGVMILDNKGAIKSSESMRFEDLNLFFESENERDIALSEVKWDNKALILEGDSLVKASPSINVGTCFDSTGDTLEKREAHALRTMTFLLNIEFRYEDEIGVFSEAPDGKGGLRRLSETACKKFSECYKEDIDDYLLMLKTFTGYLDFEKMQVLSNIGTSSIKDYNWIVGSDIGAELRSDISERRKAAAERFPLLFKALKNFNYQSVQEYLNYGEGELIDALAENIKIPADTLRKFEHICPADIGVTSDESIHVITEFMRSAFMPDNIENMSVEERRNFIQMSFLVTKLEHAIFKNSGNDIGAGTLKFATSESSDFPSHEEIFRAIDNLRSASTWLYTFINIQGNALVGKDNNSFRRIPNFLPVLTTGRTVKEAVEAINFIADNMQLNEEIIRRSSPRRNMRGVIMEWASMFREPSTRLGDGTMCRVLTSKAEMDDAFRRTGIYIATAYGTAYETMRQYVLITDEDGTDLGIITVSPNDIIRGDFFQRDVPTGVDAISYTKEASDEMKERMNEKVALFKESMVAEPDKVAIEFLQGERYSREANLADCVPFDKNVGRTYIYCPTIECNASSLASAMGAIQQALPQVLQNVREYDDIAAVSSSYIEYQTNAMREEKEIRNRVQSIHRPSMEMNMT